jgi:hypothetical protein
MGDLKDFEAERNRKTLPRWKLYVTTFGVVRLGKKLRS